MIVVCGPVRGCERREGDSRRRDRGGDRERDEEGSGGIGRGRGGCGERVGRRGGKVERIELGLGWLNLWEIGGKRGSLEQDGGLLGGRRAVDGLEVTSRGRSGRFEVFNLVFERIGKSTKDNCKAADRRINEDGLASVWGRSYKGKPLRLRRLTRSVGEILKERPRSRAVRSGRSKADLSDACEALPTSGTHGS